MVQRSLAGPIFGPPCFHPSSSITILTIYFLLIITNFILFFPFPLFSATRRIDIAQLSCGPAIQHVARYPENKIRFFQMDQFSFHIPYGGNYTLILRTFSSVS